MKLKEVIMNIIVLYGRFYDLKFLCNRLFFFFKVYYFEIMKLILMVIYNVDVILVDCCKIIEVELE